MAQHTLTQQQIDEIFANRRKSQHITLANIEHLTRLNRCYANSLQKQWSSLVAKPIKISHADTILASAKKLPVAEHGSAAINIEPIDELLLISIDCQAIDMLVTSFFAGNLVSLEQRDRWSVTEEKILRKAIQLGCRAFNQVWQKYKFRIQEVQLNSCCNAFEPYDCMVASSFTVQAYGKSGIVNYMTAYNTLRDMLTASK